MKYQFLFSIIFLFKIVTASAQHTGSSDLSDLKWPLGNWQMEKKNGLLLESWQQDNDSTFSETSYLQNTSGERKLLEKVQIIMRDNQLYYVPTVADQNNQQPIKFLITTSSKNHFVAENPEHDFPKRIMYEMRGKDSLYARIDGGSAMPGKKSDFYYSRQKK